MRDSTGTRRYASLTSVNSEIKWKLQSEETKEKTTDRGQRQGKKQRGHWLEIQPSNNLQILEVLREEQIKKDM